MTKHLKDEWQEYHEPLARIYRTVKEALSYHRNSIENYRDRSLLDYSDEDIEQFFMNGLMVDEEIRPELENLIQKMIEGIEND